jgi:hypothetical protein
MRGLGVRLISILSVTLLVLMPWLDVAAARPTFSARQPTPQNPGDAIKAEVTAPFRSLVGERYAGAFDPTGDGYDDFGHNYNAFVTKLSPDIPVVRSVRRGQRDRR